MSLFDELSWRGLVNQVTHPELKDELEKGPITLYCGFDPSAESLHIGSLVPIMGLAHFQRAGHWPIALVGGGTGLIGDPSGKSAERTLLTTEQVEINVRGIRSQLERFLRFDGPSAAIMQNNGEWLCKLSLIDFLRDIGKHFSVNAMLARDSVRSRLEDRDHGISYTEFTYSLLQAYDFLHLSDTFGCRLQVGGSDQWGNIVVGMDLTRRLRGRDTFGLTFPLVTKSDGAKFGKSESGNVWLDAGRTSPYKFYQFWINQADADVGRFLRFFTFLEKATIEALEAEHATAPEKRVAQRRLAEEVTRIVHGEQALADAQRASQAMFGGDLTGLDEATLRDVFDAAPLVELPCETLATDTSGAIAAKVLGASNSDVRRLVDNGGLYFNEVVVRDLKAAVEPSTLLHGKFLLVRKGKKDYRLVWFMH